MLNLTLKELFKDGPCLIDSSAGLQSASIRHVFMACMVNLLSKDKNEPIKMLEIGSWTGCSVLTWSQAIDKYCSHKGSILCIDSWGDYISKEDITRDFITKDDIINNTIKDHYEIMHRLSKLGISYDIFLHNIKFAPQTVKINHFRGNSRDVLSYLASNSFDLIYVDGSHYLGDVAYDISNSDRLLKQNGIMCGDDLELQFMSCDQNFSLQQKNIDYTVDPKTGHSFHPGVTVDVHNYFGEVSCLAGFWFMRKSHKKYEKINFSNLEGFIPNHFPEYLVKQINQQVGRSNSSERNIYFK